MGQLGSSWLIQPCRAAELASSWFIAQNASIATRWQVLHGWNKQCTHCLLARTSGKNGAKMRLLRVPVPINSGKGVVPVLVRQ